MKLAAPFGLLALVPAALNAAAPQGSATIVLSLCRGDGAPATISVPLRRSVPRSGDGGDSGNSACCAKGCHATSSRKRGNCHI